MHGFLLRSTPICFINFRTQLLFAHWAGQTFFRRLTQWNLRATWDQKLLLIRGTQHWNTFCTPIEYSGSFCGIQTTGWVREILAVMVHRSCQMIWNYLDSINAFHILFKMIFRLIDIITLATFRKAVYLMEKNSWNLLHALPCTQTNVSRIKMLKFC